MTRQRDIGRVLDEWLAPGPTDAPDRILDVLADRIATTPQRRFPRAHERFRPVTPFFKLLAAATLALAVGLVVAPLAAAPNQAHPSPSPTPPPSLASEGLSYRWTRAPSPGSQPDQRVWVEFSGEDSMSIVDYNGGVNWSQRVELGQPGLLDLVQIMAPAVCDAPATYAWRLSPRGARLTLSAITDDCPERAALVQGEYVRNTGGCADVDYVCAGPLDAGSYFSTEFAPRTGETTIVGGLSYTVPDGWENDSDYPAHYSLRPDASTAYALAHPGSFPAQVLVLARPYAAAQTDDCSNPRDPAVGHSIPELVAWLEGHPGLTTGTPEDIVIGDLQGVAIDIDIDPAWTTTCTGYPSPVVALFQSGPGRGWESTWEVGGVGTERDPARVILLQVAQDVVAAVLIYPGRTTTLDAFVDEAMPIIETFRFER